MGTLRRTSSERYDVSRPELGVPYHYTTYIIASCTYYINVSDIISLIWRSEVYLYKVLYSLISTAKILVLPREEWEGMEGERREMEWEESKGGERRREMREEEKGDEGRKGEGWRGVGNNTLLHPVSFGYSIYLVTEMTEVTVGVYLKRNLFRADVCT